MCKLLNIGIINTLRMNYHYFGWGGVLRCYILAARNLHIKKLGGTIEFRDKPRRFIIQIGFPTVGIFDTKYEKSIWQNGGTISVGNRTILGQGTRISNHGKLHLGNDFTVSANSSLICKKGITFGDDVLLSWDTLVMDTDLHRIYGLEKLEKSVNEPREIKFGDHVWVGCRCTVLKGSSIPSNTVIAAGSVISGTFVKENTIIGSNQRVLKDRVTWKR
ncbi:acyltransferase [Desulfosporosinus sp. OT]|uniref:acyltransferase n=1 Tax=Desulfosporosinus sp. OT TaxID=913865 RepID=UPI001300C34C|nr:acyltransferase [Desulfosporosinus sp. OT]